MPSSKVARLRRNRSAPYSRCGATGRLLTTMKRLSPLAKATRTSLSFPDTKAQYIRLTYLDHHAQQAGNFPNTFAFTMEVEAYRTK